MRAMHEDAVAALDSGRFAVRQMFKITLPGPEVYAIWNDAYTVEIDGVTYYAAAGRLTFATASAAMDLSVRSLEVTLSAIGAVTMSGVYNQPWHQRPVLISEAIVAPDAPRVLHVYPVFSGFLDQLPWKEAVDGLAALTARCEGINRELDRKGARVRSDADQRQIDASDGFFKNVAAAIATDIVWGAIPATQAAQPAQKRDKLFGIF